MLFHGKRHPREMAENHIREYLSHLAVERNVSASR
ncbi:MAG: phage integrase N-terminal SAM-like domain-containing protein [Pyrinomonadaceae bacterium]|nr:phage integrase N-terminal SAM-like domain-containing protein [Pyrinomonadaceae bacterium]